LGSKNELDRENVKRKRMHNQLMHVDLKIDGDLHIRMGKSLHEIKSQKL
jgi:hypothetical protein